jgi:hypothetical protein
MAADEFAFRQRLSERTNLFSRKPQVLAIQ